MPLGRNIAVAGYPSGRSRSALLVRNALLQRILDRQLVALRQVLDHGVMPRFVRDFQERRAGRVERAGDEVGQQDEGGARGGEMRVRIACVNGMFRAPDSCQRIRGRAD